MNKTIALSVVLAASVVAVGCAFEHTASMVSPSAASPVSAAAIPGGSASAPAAVSLVGLWESNALPTLPSPSSCGNFRYEIASQTANSIAGSFTAGTPLAAGAGA